MNSDYEAFWKKVMEQREELYMAFVAKYGGEPDDFVQVEVCGEHGLPERFFIRRKTKAEKKIERLSELYQWDHIPGLCADGETV